MKKYPWKKSDGGTSQKSRMEGNSWESGLGAEESGRGQQLQV